MYILDFLNQNSGVFAVIFSAAVAIATVVYAILTWRLVKETRRMREAQTEPLVSINVQPHEGYIMLIDMNIQNIGLGPAYDLTFQIDPDFECKKDTLLSELSMMTNGIKYLPPGQKIRFHLTNLFQDFEKKMKTPFNIQVKYLNGIGKALHNTYLVDLSQFEGISQMPRPPLYSICDDIKHLRTSIERLASGFKRLKVVVYTQQDIQKELEKYTQETGNEEE